MNDWQRKVKQFHEAMGLPVGDYTNPRPSRVCHRFNLIEEEFDEFDKATDELPIDPEDFAEEHHQAFEESIDALMDLIYVTIGTAVEWGVDLDCVMDEVHVANMAKGDGPVRADGKKLKPPGWKPPDIARAIATSKALAVNAQVMEAIEGGDINTCPRCGGPADNGHDREMPPRPYYCTRCEA